MSNTIDRSLYLSAHHERQKTGSANILGKDDFLKLLMTQLKYQDPLNPMEDKEYISQMAQFSSLEQMTNMRTSIEKLVTAQEQSIFLAYSQLVGKEITWHRITDSLEGVNEVPIIEEGKGRVTALQFEKDSVTFVLEDGSKVAPGNVSQIHGQSDENYLVQASSLIGKTVTYLNDKQEEQKAEVNSVSFKDGKTIFQLADDRKTCVVASQIIKIE